MGGLLISSNQEMLCLWQQHKSPKTRGKLWFWVDAQALNMVLCWWIALNMLKPYILSIWPEMWHCNWHHAKGVLCGCHWVDAQALNMVLCWWWISCTWINNSCPCFHAGFFGLAYELQNFTMLHVVCTCSAYLPPERDMKDQFISSPSKYCIYLFSFCSWACVLLLPTSSSCFKWHYYSTYKLLEDSFIVMVCSFKATLFSSWHNKAW